MGFSLSQLLGRAAAHPQRTARKRAEQCLERGVAAEHASDSGGALRWFDAAVDSDPAFAQGHMNRGIALRALGRLEEALAAQQRAIELDPACAPAHFNLAMIHDERRQAALAEAQLRLGLAHQPDNMT